MTEDEAIDKVLSFINDLEGMEDIEYFAETELHYQRSKYLHLANRMVYEDLVSMSAETDSMLFIRPRGREIVRNGGYIKHLNDLSSEKRRQDEKVEYELKLNKYLYTFRWFPHILAIAAVIISIIALLE